MQRYLPQHRKYKRNETSCYHYISDSFVQQWNIQHNPLYNPILKYTKAPCTLLQLDLFNNVERPERRCKLNNFVDHLYNRFEYGTICAASLMGENTLAQDKCVLVVMLEMM